MKDKADKNQDVSMGPDMVKWPTFTRVFDSCTLLVHLEFSDSKLSSAWSRLLAPHSEPGCRTAERLGMLVREHVLL